MPVAIISVDYNEPDPATYQGVTVHCDGEVHRFATGSAPADFQAAVTKARALAGPEQVYRSSSVDHYQMDGGQPLDEEPGGEEVKDDG